jgi:hypothetical protein
MVIDHTKPALSASTSGYGSVRTYCQSAWAGRRRTLALVLNEISRLATDITPGARSTGRIKSVRSVFSKMHNTGRDIDQIGASGSHATHARAGRDRHGSACALQGAPPHLDRAQVHPASVKPSRVSISLTFNRTAH